MTTYIILAEDNTVKRKVKEAVEIKTRLSFNHGGERELPNIYETIGLLR